jgi:uncharacterized protein YndB with AHSA1/START domain
MLWREPDQLARRTRRTSMNDVPTRLPPIRLEIETPASPADTWETLTVPERVAEWFTQASKLGALGSAYRLDFGDGTVVEGVVTRLEPGRRFAHTWAWEDTVPGQETEVSWSVEPLEGGGSRVTLVHDGWAEAALDETARDEHESYWVGYLDDLAAVLEGDG